MKFAEYVKQRKPTTVKDDYGYPCIDLRTKFCEILKLKMPSNFAPSQWEDFESWLKEQNAKPDTLEIGQELWKEYTKNAKRSRRSTSDRNS